MEGDSLEDFSIRTADKWKIGQKGKDNGVLLVVKNDRKIRIEVGRGLEHVLTDLLSGRIIDRVISPYFKSGRFDQGFEAGIAAILQATSGEFKADLVSAGGRQGNEPPPLLFQFLFFGLFIITFLGRIWRPLGVIAGAAVFPLAFLFGLLPFSFLLLLLLIPAAAAVRYVTRRRDWLLGRGRRLWWLRWWWIRRRRRSLGRLVIMKAETFFTEADKKKIAKAVRAVERKTSGEIAVMVVDRSDAYPEGQILAGVLVGPLLALAATELFWGGALWIFVVSALVLTALCGWLTHYLPAVKKFFTPRARLEIQVRDRALAAFYEKGLYKTRNESGVLFLFPFLNTRSGCLPTKSSSAANILKSLFPHIFNVISSAICY